MKIGNSSVTNILIGSSVVQKVYIGTDIVWENPNTGTPLAPQNVRSSAITHKALLLEWNSVLLADDYTVEYKESSSGTWLVYNASTTQLSQQFNGLLFETSYDFRVSANNVSGSTYSITHTVSTTAPAVLARINVGGPLIAATDGAMDWGGDEDTSPSPYLTQNNGWDSVFSSTTSYTGNIPNTTPLTIFDSDRELEDTGGFPGDLVYQIPLSAGDYKIRYYATGPFGKYGKVGSTSTRLYIDGNLPPQYSDMDLVQLFGNKTGGMIDYDFTFAGGNLEISLNLISGLGVIGGIEIIAN